MGRQVPADGGSVQPEVGCRHAWDLVMLVVLLAPVGDGGMILRGLSVLLCGGRIGDADQRVLAGDAMCQNTGIGTLCSATRQCPKSNGHA
eukprot:8883092-Lingulodinium_polyedra.AAC.1